MKRTSGVSEGWAVVASGSLETPFNGSDALEAVSPVSAGEVSGVLEVTVWVFGVPDESGVAGRFGGVAVGVVAGAFVGVVLLFEVTG